MNEKIKFLIGGLLLGALLLFAGLGIKNTISPTPSPQQVATAPALSQPAIPQPDPSSTIIIPPTDGTGTTPMSLADTPQSMPGVNTTQTSQFAQNTGNQQPPVMPQTGTVQGETSKPANEQKAIEEGQPEKQAADESKEEEDPEKQVEEESDGEDQVVIVEQTKDDDKPVVIKEIVEKPKTEKTVVVKQVTTAPPSNRGTVKVIVRKAENGVALNANIYVQRPNGKLLRSVNYVSSSTFSLKPGRYRITVKAANRIDLSRNIRIRANTAINEVFRLSATNARVVSAVGNGKIRVTAVNRANGRPVAVNFTIRRANGKLIRQVNNVSVAEVSLAPGNYIASYYYYGKTNSVTMKVRRGQTTVYTFNLPINKWRRGG